MSGETSKLLISMTCPSCGGQVECEEGESLAICQYCDAVFALDSSEGSSKVMYKLTVEKEAAVKEVKSWMKKGPKAPDLVEKSTFDEVYPIYIPFWRLIARGKACVCGYVEEKDDDNHTRREPREVLINREYIYTSSACNVGDLGLEGIRVPENAKPIFFDDADIVTFGVTTSKDDSFREGEEYIKNEAISDGARSLDGVTFQKGFVFPKGFTLVYYPFWVIRYTYEERSYFATVDGITGDVLTGRAPGSVASQANSAGIGGAASGALVGIGGGLCTGMGEDGGMVFIILLIAAACIFYFCYQRFRYGDEIITGNLEGKGLKSGDGVGKIETISHDAYDHFY